MTEAYLSAEATKLPGAARANLGPGRRYGQTAVSQGILLHSGYGVYSVYSVYSVYNVYSAYYSAGTAESQLGLERRGGRAAAGGGSQGGAEVVAIMAGEWVAGSKEQ